MSASGAGLVRQFLGLCLALLAAQALAGPATLSLSTRDSETGGAVAATIDAVEIEDTTGTALRFRSGTLWRQRAGTYLLEVRAVGYQPMRTYVQTEPHHAVRMTAW